MSGDNLTRHRMTLPAQTADLEKLRVGDVVFLDGLVYTGREGVYKKVVDEGAAPPVDLAALTNANFHCSPAAAPDDAGGFRVGAVTATASFRFTRWMPQWFELSKARVIIGKGGMSGEDYRKVFVPHGAVYLTTVGYGTGALLGRGVKRVQDVYWLDELGISQAIWVLEVENFGPFIVDGDLAGNSLFEQANESINAKLDRAYAGLRQPALRRHGETGSREEELI